MLETNVLIQQFPYLGLFLLLILGTLGFPFPEDGILLLGGFLVAHSVVKPLPTFLVIYSGLLVTDFILYSVGKKYGRKIVEYKQFQRIITSERLIKLEEKFKKWGILVIFFGRHLIVLRGQIFLTAGAMRMFLKKFLLADAASALITITLWGGIGYAGGNGIQILRKNITRIEHIIVATLTILIVSAIFLKYFKGRRNSVKRFLFTKPNQESFGG
jgi:membrane protein DedA with SNARE-associated domain